MELVYFVSAVPSEPVEFSPPGTLLEAAAVERVRRACGDIRASAAFTEPEFEGLFLDRVDPNCIIIHKKRLVHSDAGWFSGGPIKKVVDVLGRVWSARLPSTPCLQPAPAVARQCSQLPAAHAKLVEELKEVLALKFKRD